MRAFHPVAPDISHGNWVPVEIIGGVIEGRGLRFTVKLLLSTDMHMHITQCTPRPQILCNEGAKGLSVCSNLL